MLTSHFHPLNHNGVDFKVSEGILIATHQDEGSSESGMAAITLSDYS